MWVQRFFSLPRVSVNSIRRFPLCTQPGPFVEYRREPGACALAHLTRNDGCYMVAISAHSVKAKLRVRNNV